MCRWSAWPRRRGRLSGRRFARRRARPRTRARAKAANRRNGMMGQSSFAPGQTTIIRGGTWLDASALTPRKAITQVPVRGCGQGWQCWPLSNASPPSVCCLRSVRARRRRRPIAPRCAGSISAFPSRRRTWFIPRLMWRWSLATSPSIASTPTSSSSMAVNRRRRGPRLRKGPRWSRPMRWKSAAASGCSRFGDWPRACRRPTWWPKASRPRPTSKARD